MVYSADETVLFAGSIDGAVRTFDATSGQEVASVTATEQVYGLTKSPDGRRLAVHTLGAALIWDISPFTGALRAEGTGTLGGRHRRRRDSPSHDRRRGV